MILLLLYNLKNYTCFNTTKAVISILLIKEFNEISMLKTLIK